MRKKARIWKSIALVMAAAMALTACSRRKHGYLRYIGGFRDGSGSNGGRNLQGHPAYCGYPAVSIPGFAQEQHVDCQTDVRRHGFGKS